MHRAVEELLTEGPAESLTLPSIAARAGVHPTTLYRRWGSVADLLSEVAISRFSGGVVVPETGNLREDLERWLTEMITDLADPDVQALVRAAVGSGQEVSRACTADRREQVAAMLDRERARGGAVPDLDLAVDSLLGPLYYRIIFTGRTAADPDFARELVTALLR